MHACEAMLAAFDATSDARYLQRASALAESVTSGLAGQADGLVWEHYSHRWQLDEDYHRDDPAHLFRPWGFQTGHLTEWAKLLLILEAREPDAQSGLNRVSRAHRLFDTALLHGWDSQHGGLVYGFAGARDAIGRDGAFRVCDGHKYFWVQAESLAAAARIAQRCGDASACEWYERLWTYAWQHFVDHRHGAWYRMLGPDNRKLSDEKSPPGKTDYHTMGACYDVLDALRS
jgi:mannose/cellobiose epimerase-like protein (N-acyl-D-glucosamine 2-epimerase family)